LTFSFGKSANKGECQQPCRREFLIRDADEEKEYIIGQDYVLSPKDLCTMEFIDKLIKAGIHSFKIEGRMRSVEYIKVVVGAYRQAIDAYFKKELTESLKDKLKDKLYTVYNRGFSSGFYFGKPQQWNSSHFQKSYEKVFLGEVTNFYNRINVAEVIIRSGQLRKGDKILIIGKHTPASYADAVELQQEHEYVDEVGKGESVGIKLPFKVRRNDQVFLWRPIQK
jgi:putative protease